MTSRSLRGRKVPTAPRSSTVSLRTLLRRAHRKISPGASLSLPDPELEDAVAACLRAGADPNGTVATHPRHPFLFLAVEVGQEALVRRLLAAGARPDARAADGSSVLHHVRHAALVPLLVAAGAPLEAGYTTVSLPQVDGTPLLHAIQEAPITRFAVIPALLRAGANPNARCRRGRTALHHLFECHLGWRPQPASSISRLLELSAALLDAGAAPALEDAEGQSAWNVARFHAKSSLQQNQVPWDELFARLESARLKHEMPLGNALAGSRLRL